MLPGLTLKMTHSMVLDDMVMDNQGLVRYKGYLIDPCNPECFVSTDEIDLFLQNITRVDIQKEFGLAVC